MQLQYEALLARNAELQQGAGFVIDRTVVAGGFAMAHSLSRKNSAAHRQFHLTDSGCGVWGLGLWNVFSNVSYIDVEGVLLLLIR